jgi:hypothetical protein
LITVKVKTMVNVNLIVVSGIIATATVLLDDILKNKPNKNIKAKFDIEFPDLGKRGVVEANQIKLNITDDETLPGEPVVKYIIRLGTEKIILHKIIKSQEWLPYALSPNTSDYIVKRTVGEIEKFENKKT